MGSRMLVCCSPGLRLSRNYISALMDLNYISALTDLNYITDLCVTLEVRYT